MSRFAKRFWLSAFTFVLIAASLIVPTAHADPIRQNPTPTVQPSAVDAAAHLAKGITAFTETFDTPTAYAEFNTALQYDPQMWVAYLWRARLFYEVNTLDRALADATRVLEIQPENIEALILRAAIYAGPYRFDIPWGTGWAYDGYGRQHDLAVADIEAALALDDHNPEAWLTYAQIWVTARLAERTYNLFVNIFDDTEESGDTLPLDFDQLFADLGECLRHARQFGIDEAEFEYFLAFGMLAPFRYDAAWYEEEEIKQARESFALSAFLMAGTPKSLYAKAMVAWAEGRTADAYAVLQDATTQFPNYALAQHWLMSMAFLVHDWNAEDPYAAAHTLAPASAARAVELAPYSPLYRYMQIVLTEASDQPAALERLLEEWPNYPPALRWLADYYLDEESCERAQALADVYLTAPLEVGERESFQSWFEEEYRAQCVPPTPTPTALPVTSPTFQVGQVVTLPSYIFFPLDSAPGDYDRAVICTGGTQATVLQIVQTPPNPRIYVQLECDGGIGWIDEALLN